MKLNSLFQDGKEVSWPIIVLFLVALVGMSIFVNQVYFQSDISFYGPTRGLINDTLIASLMILAVTVMPVMFALGKLRPKDVGLIGSRLPAAIVFTLLVWALLQLVELIAGLLAGGVMVNPQWADRGVLPMLGLLIAQLCGNALVEEIEFRGFLLPQLYLKLGALKHNALLRIAAAVALMAVIFALYHVPNMIAFGQSFGALPMIALLGLLFALIYLRTDNLFLAVGLHALHNAPTLLFAQAIDYGMPLIVLELLLIVFWPQLARGYARLTGRGVTPVSGQEM